MLLPAFDSVTLGLSGLKLYDYVIGSPLQLLGVLLVVMNYALDPLLTFAFMNRLRKPLRDLLLFNKFFLRFVNFYRNFLATRRRARTISATSTTTSSCN